MSDPLKKPRFEDIPQFPHAGYAVNIGWGLLEDYLGRSDPKIELEPDYQRGHVWTEAQQSAFVEYGLMGGENSMVITTNCPGWMSDFRGPFELVDGLQRVTAVLRFVRGEIPAFGHTIGQYGDHLTKLGSPNFLWRVCALPTRREVLHLYLLLNTGGVVHSPQEIERVRGLLEMELRAPEAPEELRKKARKGRRG